MVRVLVEAGLLETSSDQGAGNRNHLALTRRGQTLVQRWGPELEQRFADLVKTAHVPYQDYLDHTNRLLDELDPPVHDLAAETISARHP